MLYVMCLSRVRREAHARFNVRQHRVGRTHTGNHSHGHPLGFKPLIKPSNEAIKRHTRKPGQIVRDHRAAPQAALLAHLNPVIHGWAHY